MKESLPENRFLYDYRGVHWIPGANYPQGYFRQIFLIFIPQVRLYLF